MPAPTLLTSVTELAGQFRDPPSILLDLTPLGSTRMREYRSVWPQVQVHAYGLEPAREPGLSAVPLPLSNVPNWGAPIRSGHGVLADIESREKIINRSHDQSLQSTIDIYAAEHQLEQIPLLVLPASSRALPTLLGASNLLATADIQAVAIISQPAEMASPELMLEFAGILAKFDYRWLSAGGALLSIAVPVASATAPIARIPNPSVPSWLMAARSFLIPPDGVIHVGEFEARERKIYHQQGITKIFIVGQNAKTHERLVGRVSESPDLIYLDIEGTTLDQLADRHDFRQCSALHIEFPTLGLSGLIGAAATLRHIEIVNIELKEPAGAVDGITLRRLDIALLASGFCRISFGPSVYPNRNDAVYVRKERLWTCDPLKAAAIALQHADCSIRNIGYIGANAGACLRASISYAEHRQSLGDLLAQIPQNHTATHVVRPTQPPVLDPQGPQREVAYLLQHHDRQKGPKQAASEASIAKVDVTVLSDEPTLRFREILSSAKSSTRLSAIAVLGSVGDSDLAHAVATAFDQGFLLDRATAASTGRIFIRSDLIREPGRWFEQDNQYGARHFRFSLLGKLGRFGNQLFQLWHLILSGLRHAATVSTCKWDVQKYFGLESLEREGNGEFLRVEPHDWRVMGLWALESLPDDVDFWGHFQWIPPLFQRHRVFLSRLFDLRPDWSAEMARVIASLHASKQPLTAFHVRRTDYVNHPSSEMREIPIAWYRAALEPLRHTTIYAGSDDIEFVRRELSEFSILSSDDFAESRLPALIIDHCVMRAADTLLMVNSTYSRTAAMLAKDHQVALLPSIQQQAFLSYSPWSDPSFWLRFNSDDADEYARRVAELEHWLTSAGLSE
jgi:hypothetical protein